MSLYDKLKKQKTQKPKSVKKVVNHHQKALNIKKTPSRKIHGVLKASKETLLAVLPSMLIIGLILWGLSYFIPAIGNFFNMIGYGFKTIMTKSGHILSEGGNAFLKCFQHGFQKLHEGTKSLVAKITPHTPSKTQQAYADKGLLYTFLGLTVFSVGCYFFFPAYATCWLGLAAIGFVGTIGSSYYLKSINDNNNNGESSTSPPTESIDISPSLSGSSTQLNHDVPKEAITTTDNTNDENNLDVSNKDTNNKKKNLI